MSKLDETAVALDCTPGPEIYQRAVEGPLGRALSRLDTEMVSPSRGSFDRTWWGWKFADFSASRFQEGVFTLAWLATSSRAPFRARGTDRLIDYVGAAIHFWSSLQHRDGSFDEAYPFERSLAATAFTGFYVGCGIERIRDSLPIPVIGTALKSIDRAAAWLARNGEYHGILSNHLAAAAAALQVAGDLAGTDRYRTARDRYLEIVFRHQDRKEGWLREYGGADPGYQSHGMFYLTEIWRRTSDSNLLDCLKRATDFVAWFAHPDGTLGGEYASRGTKFAYPAAFEILAETLPAAAAVAAHLRRGILLGRGVGLREIDAWNLFPVLNNYLFAADTAKDLPSPPKLPWYDFPGWRVFDQCGIAVGRFDRKLVVSGLALGGTTKIWDISRGKLLYEDCGYALMSRRPFSSQSQSTWTAEQIDGTMRFRIIAPFAAVPGLRPHPWRFLFFRAFTLTIGRLHAIARITKRLLVEVLIRRKKVHPTRLERLIWSDGEDLFIEDRLTGLDRAPLQIDRQVSFHMGSARYADLFDSLGAELPCPCADYDGATTAHRTVWVRSTSIKAANAGSQKR